MDWAREQTIQTGATPEQVLLIYEQEGTLSKLKRARHPMRLKPHPSLGLLGRVVCPVYAGTKHYGYISILESNRPLEELDLVAAESAAMMVAFEFVNQEKVRETELRLEASLFDDILACQPADDEDELARRAELFGYPIREPQVAVVLGLQDRHVGRKAAVDHIETENHRQRILEGFGRALEAAGLPTLWRARRDQGLYLVAIGVKAWPRTIDKVCREFIAGREATDPGYDLSIGVGSVFDRPSKARGSMNHAEQALTVGRRLRGEGSVTLFDDLGYHRVLLARVDSNDVDQFAQQQLGALVEYDARHRTALVKTLETYFEKNGQLNATAETLFIHINTLYHRLRRIQEIAKIELEDPTARFNLMLALKVLEIKRLARETGEEGTGTASNALAAGDEPVGRAGR